MLKTTRFPNGLLLRLSMPVILASSLSLHAQQKPVVKANDTNTPLHLLLLIINFLMVRLPNRTC